MVWSWFINLIAPDSSEAVVEVFDELLPCALIPVRSVQRVRVKQDLILEIERFVIMVKFFLLDLSTFYVSFQFIEQLFFSTESES